MHTLEPRFLVFLDVKLLLDHVQLVSHAQELVGKLLGLAKMALDLRQAYLEQMLENLFVGVKAPQISSNLKR